MFDAFRTTFQGGAGRGVRLLLTPALLFFAFVFACILEEPFKAGRLVGVILGLGLVVTCLAGVLALWGVKHAGRVVTGFVALCYGYYLADEVVIQFAERDPSGERSDSNLIGAVLGCLFIGLPCLVYTILGRFTPWKELEAGDEFEWMSDGDVGEDEDRADDPAED